MEYKYKIEFLKNDKGFSESESIYWNLIRKVLNPKMPE